MALGNDPEVVRDQYADESRLEIRRSVWRPTTDGTTPQDVAAAAVAAAHPTRLLEVGCGTGAFAERLAAENPGCSIVATDQSFRFVDLTGARGVEARVANVMDLPFPDTSFDVVVAMWMLYHMSDLDRGLAEVRRVLRPGGTLVAATNGDGHLADLLVDAGGQPLVTQFSTENGAVALGRHFADVHQTDVATRAVFPDHASACAYLATFDESLAAGLPAFGGAREYAGATSVFLAR